MTSQDPDSARARQLFEAAVDRLDAPAVQRLQRARRLALATAERPVARRFGGVPAGAFAAAVLALGLAWWLPARSPSPDASQSTAAALDADAPVSEEDAELYAWLGAGPVATGDGERGL